MSNLSFGNRLASALTQAGLTQYRLSKLSRLSEQAISLIVNGKKRPSDENLQLLANTPELNLDLATLQAWRALDDLGEQPIERAYQTLHPPNPPDANPSLGPQVLSGTLLTQELEHAGQPDGFYRFPCLAEVSAGELTFETTPDLVEYYEFADISVYDSGMFCLKIRGNSMAPEFRDGGILLVRQAEDFKNNRVYIIQTPQGETTLKVVRFDGLNGSILIPINPNYQPIPLKNIQISKMYEVLEYKLRYL